MPEHWEPEEKDDPTQPKPKDPNAPDIPSMDVQQTPENTQADTAADPYVLFRILLLPISSDGAILYACSIFALTALLLRASHAHQI